MSTTKKKNQSKRWAIFKCKLNSFISIGFGSYYQP